MVSRREFLKLTGASAGALAALRYGLVRRGFAAPAVLGLSDPADQPKFANLVPDAMAPGFKILTPKSNDTKLKVFVGETTQYTGLVSDGNQLPTQVWGYGKKNWNNNIPTWPGPTFEAKSKRKVEVRWENRLVNQSGATLPHLLPVDTTLHWCYSLPEYTQYNIDDDGVPMVAHLHGGHTDFQFDGNPEFFFSPGYQVKGPRFVDKTYIYDNDQPAGNLWYHDHALGITRLNVYAGLAGFYFIRDKDDTGDEKNKLGLPAWPYEKAYAIQDRMFNDDGSLFYPAFQGEPAWTDFITPESEDLMYASGLFGEPPNLGPSALAEFFGDHMVVNGLIWPKENVEPRNYRLHLLNGTDSRFMVIQFRQAASLNGENGQGALIPFTVIGSDQGLASEPTVVTRLLSEPGSRYDIIFDFKEFENNRIIMENFGGDEPFGGDIPGPQIYSDTDKVMAFDVVEIFDTNVPDVSPAWTNYGAVLPAPTRLRKVALFEGMDEFGRLQPLLGSAEPATDYLGNPVNWPNKTVYSSVGLTGQMEGSIAWHSPTTENPALGSTEEWEVWNATGDAHPVHLHLVHFEVLGRQEIVWDSATNEDDRVLDPTGITAPMPNGDGTYLVTQPTVQHNSVAGFPNTYGMGFKMVDLTYGAEVPVTDLPEYVENAPKDMVTALPSQITRIKATFDKPGRYVWHCHILSHEDHEMMRVLHVGPGA